MRSRLLLLSSIMAAGLAAAPAVAAAQRFTRCDCAHNRYGDSRYEINDRIERARERTAERVARAQERAHERAARAYATRVRIDRDRDYLRDERMWRTRERIHEAQARARSRYRW